MDWADLTLEIQPQALAVCIGCPLTTISLPSNAQMNTASMPLLKVADVTTQAASLDITLTSD